MTVYELIVHDYGKYGVLVINITLTDTVNGSVAPLGTGNGDN